MSEKSSQQHINEKKVQINKQATVPGNTVYVSASIDRFNLRAKNYAKQEKVVWMADNYSEATATEKVGLEPYVDLLARLCENSMQEDNASEAGRLVS